MNLKNLIILKKTFLILCMLIVISASLLAQIMYQNVSNKNLSLGSYGRIGADWSFNEGSAIGRRLNLNNMGSIGGRLEEQDYLELVPAIHFLPFKEGDSTIINVQFRFAAYSKSLTLMGNSSTSSPEGLTFAIPEMYAEARNIANSGVNAWVGSRLYRGADVHVIDHFYFNDHSGQGFGVEYKNTRFCTLFIATTDTTATVPPYFYINIESGTATLALRQRVVNILEHDILLSKKNTLTLLGEYHHMGKAEGDPDEELLDSELQHDYPADYGFVLGARLVTELKGYAPGGFNKLAIRYGGRIANGGDGGMARTWLTFGAPNLEKQDFAKAYSISLVDEVLLNINKNHSLSAYVVYTQSKGGAKTKGLAETYHEKEVYNYKQDFTIGFRETYYISDIFHLLSEMHYSQRQDGEDPTYSMFKISLAPTLAPTGERSYWARPHLRLITSVAFYNEATKNNLYSPHLQFVGPKSVGLYFGVKAEWFLWN